MLSFLFGLVVLILIAMLDLAVLGDGKECSQNRSDGGQSAVAGQPLLPPGGNLSRLAGSRRTLEAHRISRQP